MTGVDENNRADDHLYPPGALLHVVRTWNTGQLGWTAVWTEYSVYNNVWISPVMVHDHMPKGVIDGLDGVGFWFVRRLAASSKSAMILFKGSFSPSAPLSPAHPYPGAPYYSAHPCPRCTPVPRCTPTPGDPNPPVHPQHPLHPYLRRTPAPGTPLPPVHPYPPVHPRPRCSPDPRRTPMGSSMDWMGCLVC